MVDHLCVLVDLKSVSMALIAWNIHTVIKPLNRWEFDMENTNMKGHWVGIFTSKDDKTEIDFTEQVTAKKFFMKPFVKSYLKKQQAQFVMDLKRILEK